LSRKGFFLALYRFGALFWKKFSEQLYMHIQRRNTSRKAARKRTPSLTKKYKRLRRVVAKLAHKAQ
jgi:hypothetical protein